MNTAEKENKRVKFTVVDNKEYANGGGCYCEISASSGFLQMLILSMIMMHDDGPKLDVALTDREKEMLMLIAQGKNNGDIAKQLNISIHTVKIHIRNIFQKLQVNDRTQAVVKAVQNKLINIYR